MKLSQLDEKILYNLEGNSRLPLAKLAKKLSINRTTLGYKVTKFKEQGLLMKFISLIDINALGYKGYRFYFKFSGTESTIEEEIFLWLTKCPHTFVVQSCDGSYDASIILFIKEEAYLKKIIFDFKQKYSKYISSFQVDRYLNVYHYRRTYLINQEKSKEIMGFTEKQKSIAIDSSDKKILSLLAENSQINILELAQESSLSTKTALKKIRRLEKEKIIIGYSVVLDIRKMKKEYYKLNLNLKKYDSFKFLLEYAKSIPQTIYVDETLGSYDFELNLEVTNKNELNEIIDKIKKDFNGIKSYDYFTVKKTYKLKYF